MLIKNMNYKICRAGVSLFVLFSFLVTPLFFAVPIAMAEFADGTGTVRDPYEVWDCTDMAEIGTDVGTLAANYVLMQDLDCAGDGNDVVVGSSDNAFTGIFDGQGHSINLNINTVVENTALFPVLSNATILNLSLTGAVTSTEDNVGALAADARFETVISGVSSSTNVTGVSSVGGLVGMSRYGATIKDSYTTGDVTSVGTAYRTGGLVGIVSDAYVENSYSTGTVQGYTEVGGLIGLLNEATTTIPSVYNSFSASPVVADSITPVFGGLIGNTTGNQFSVGNNFYDQVASGLGADACWTFDSTLGDTLSSCVGIDTVENQTFFYDEANVIFTIDEVAVWNDENFPIWKFSEDDYPTLWALEEELGYEGEGAGTEEDPYIISTCAELENVDNDMGASYAIVLEDEEATELDCTGLGDDAMIRSNLSAFTGTFDGNNIDVIVEIDFEGSYVGLFSRADNAAITEVKVSGNVMGDGEYIGAVIGYIEDSTISSSSASAAVTNVNADIDVGENTGGFAGEIQNSVVTDSFATGNVVSETIDVGGFAGDVDESEVTDSYATGLVSGYSYVGGFVGDSDTGSEFDSVYATGDVTATEDHIGGLIGDVIEDVIIEESYALGDVISEGDDVGGLVGRLKEDANIINSYAHGSVTGDENVGGLVGLSEELGSVVKSYSVGAVTGNLGVGGLVGTQSDSDIDFNFWDLETSGQAESAGGTGATTLSMKDLDTYTTDLGEDSWDFETIWAINSNLNNGYPYFQTQEIAYVLTELTPIPSEINTLTATYYFEFDGSGEYQFLSETCGHNSEVAISSELGAFMLTGLEYGKTYSCSFVIESTAGVSNGLQVGPFTVRTVGGSSSGSRIKSPELIYDQEVASVLELRIVTENPTSETNKCEALTMMSRVFEWQVPAANSSQYTDVPEWCRGVAAFATERGVVEGRTETSLGMETPVTRYEVATMLYRELKIRNWDFNGTDDVQFSDELIAWAKEAVTTLAKEGIIKGFANGTFGGEKGIIKQDLAVMLLRI